jgi:hypothetical protein
MINREICPKERYPLRRTPNELPAPCTTGSPIEWLYRRRRGAVKHAGSGIQLSRTPLPTTGPSLNPFLKGANPVFAGSFPGGGLRKSASAARDLCYDAPLALEPLRLGRSSSN